MMTTKQQQYEDRQTKIARVCEFAVSFGKFSDGQHRMDVDGFEIKVYDLGEKLVAYSSTKADFEQSLVEFAADYFA